MKRIGCLLLAAILLAGCLGRLAPAGPPIDQPIETTDSFLMQDGSSLPYRAWMPSDSPTTIILALHGMNDSRDAWEIPAPALAKAGMAVIAPDLRGFGATPQRGLWPGVASLTADVRTMAGLLHARYPHTRLVLMGESMGAATLMVLATQPDPPQVDGYVLVAPAVWGRSEMNLIMRVTLWLADHTLPGLTLTGRGFVQVTATDNRDALIRLSTDRLTIRATRVDALKGLVDLMDQALTSASRFHQPALFLYGGHDELVPPRATAAIWRALPANEVRAFYPNGYHLLLRDKDRAAPIGDVIAWINHPDAALPSGADKAAAAWLRDAPDN